MMLLTENERDALTEVINIAFLGTFGNMLKVQITFAVPRLQLEGLDALLSSLIIGRQEIQYALVVYTHFRIKGSEITGFLVIVLGVSSLEILLDELDKLG